MYFFWWHRCESVPKIITCVFGMIKKRFHMLRLSMLVIKMSEVQDIVKVCCVIHNMCIQVSALYDTVFYIPHSSIQYTIQYTVPCWIMSTCIYYVVIVYACYSMWYGIHYPTVHSIWLFCRIWATISFCGPDASCTRLEIYDACNGWIFTFDGKAFMVEDTSDFTKQGGQGEHTDYSKATDSITGATGCRPCFVWHCSVSL
jgi:hypothetical protein